MATEAIPFKTFWHLLLGMVARELRNRYLGSFGGKAWNILYPLLMIGVYTLVFSELIHSNFPFIRGPFGYALYLCSGLLPWLSFDDALKRSTNCLVGNFSLIQNLPFPKEILVLQYVVTSIITLVISLGILLVLEIIAGLELGPRLLFLPAVIGLQFIVNLGPSMLLSVLHVYLRDTEQLVSIALSLLFWVIPIVYVPNILPDWATRLVNLNPLTHLVAIYRALLLSFPMPDLVSVCYIMGVASVGLFCGVVVFRRLVPWVAENL